MLYWILRRSGCWAEAWDPTVYRVYGGEETQLGCCESLLEEIGSAVRADLSETRQDLVQRPGGAVLFLNYYPLQELTL